MAKNIFFLENFPSFFRKGVFPELSRQEPCFLERNCGIGIKYNIKIR
jgi:hypothetical protein